MRLVRPLQTAWRFLTRPRVFDTALVLTFVVIAVIGGLSMLAQGVTDSAARAGFFALTALPLLVRRRRPLLTAGLEVALETVNLVGGITEAVGLSLTIAFYSVGRYTSGRATLIATVASAATYGLAMELTRTTPAVWLQAAFAVAIPVGLGQIVRLRAELRERERREAADSAVRAERRRIARELHDVVAHHLSVINALVGGARATLPPGQDVTREALAGAEQTAREALAEMRQLLHVLRADDDSGADAATGVGTARLPALVAEARTAGLPTELTVTGEPVPLPAAIDHAVYRIVQEALTNTRKHAVGARASVRLSYEPEAVDVEVLDDGMAKQAPSTGFGLGGMAERVALCGGRLSTGPRAEGGFRVHARIPLEKT